MVRKTWKKKRFTQKAPNPLLLATPLMRGSSDGRYGLDNLFTLKGVRISLKDLFCKPFIISEVASLKIYHIKRKKPIKSRKVH